jgi:hypothetical protein
MYLGKKSLTLERRRFIKEVWVNQRAKAVGVELNHAIEVGGDDAAELYCQYCFVDTTTDKITWIKLLSEELAKNVGAS